MIPWLSAVAGGGGANRTGAEIAATVEREPTENGERLST